MLNSDSHRVSRRRLLITAASAAAIAATSRDAPGEVSPNGSSPSVFRVAERNGRWWFISPDDRPCLSIGLNHIDPAALFESEHENLWRDRYGNSMRRWLNERVGTDLRAWGFNSVGWVQEVVVREPTIHRHSRNFTREEYGWLDLPYCHMLPFAEFHQWEAQTRHPDFFSRDFEAWCDYVARSECVRMADDPKLIGYFYVDCPTWVHTRQFNEWKGPLFDPQKLSTSAGRQELFKIARRYYQVTHDAIRRYDPRHLILGDRYEARAPLPAEVLEAACPLVDVLSFQHFSPPVQIAADLQRWHKQTGKPVLLADACGSHKAADGTLRQDPVWYRDATRVLREVSGFVGLHLCGAYLKNRCRQRGLRDEDETPDTEAIAAITQANHELTDWASRTGAEKSA